MEHALKINLKDCADTDSGGGYYLWKINKAVAEAVAFWEVLAEKKNKKGSSSGKKEMKLIIITETSALNVHFDARMCLCRF